MNAANPGSAAGAALLDPAESMRKARPLRSWSTAQKEAVRLLFAGVHNDWSTEWMPLREGAAAQADVEVGEPDGSVLLVRDDTACWSFSEAPRRAADALAKDSQAALRAIADRMFSFDLGASTAAPVPPVIAPAVVHAAWDDWLQRMASLLKGCSLEAQPSGGASGDVVPAGPWSGALCVRWPWCNGVWQVGLPYAVVVALLGADAVAAKSMRAADAPTVAKERLDKALAEQQLGLRVMLEGVELSLGQLQQLRRDDVIPLEHLLEMPALVVGMDGSHICNGWLGRSDGRIAVELETLASLNPNNPSSKESTP